MEDLVLAPNLDYPNLELEGAANNPLTHITGKQVLAGNGEQIPQLSVVQRRDRGLPTAILETGEGFQPHAPFAHLFGLCSPGNVGRAETDPLLRL